MLAISSESLSKTYSGGLASRQPVTALTDFSVAVEQGQIFSLLGPNGAGKTTFIKVLLSLVRPTSGTATILGSRLTTVESRRNIGYLPENHRYPGYLTGGQVLSFFGQLSGMKSSTLRARIPALMEMVGMSQWKSMKVKKYSKGMMQRLGLAQALINDPRLLFLDEPTDGVDPVGRKEIRDVLQSLKQQGKTIFLNSHLLSEVELVSDRVAILDKGKLLKVGTVNELTTTGSQFTLGVSGPVPLSFKEEAMALVLKLDYNAGNIVAELETLAELNRLIDLLRKHNVEIASIVKRRSTLEESFINLITREVAR